MIRTLAHYFLIGGLLFTAKVFYDDDASADRDLAAPSTNASPATPSINTFVREHFYGTDEPFTEVFVSDRRYPETARNNLSSTNPSGVPHE